MRLEEREAQVSRLPSRSGDGYSYGGEVVLTIGDKSIIMGSSTEDYDIACHMAMAWNNSFYVGFDD